MNAGRLARWVVSIAASVAIVVVGHALFGGIANLVTVPLAVVGVTMRHDNSLGTCLPLVMLAMIVATIMGLLLFLMAVERGPAPAVHKPAAYPVTGSLTVPSSSRSSGL